MSSPPSHPLARRFPRVRRVRPVVAYGEAGETVCRYLRLEEVGQGGALLRCESELSEGSEVDLEICLAGGVIRVRSRVLYCQPAEDGAFTVGVEFLELAPGSEELLAELVLV